MSLAWRILLFALLLNVLTVGSVQIIVHQAQARWFEQQREVLQNTVQESFSELERVYNASAVDDAAASASVVRSLLRNQSLRELYDDLKQMQHWAATITLSKQSVADLRWWAQIKTKL